MLTGEQSEYDKKRVRSGGEDPGVVLSTGTTKNTVMNRGDGRKLHGRRCWRMRPSDHRTGAAEKELAESEGGYRT